MTGSFQPHRTKVYKGSERFKRFHTVVFKGSRSFSHKKKEKLIPN